MIIASDLFLFYNVNKNINNHVRPTTHDISLGLVKNVFNKSFKELLIEWSLSQYISIFEDEGYDDINEWNQLDFDECTKYLKMKRGHAKKFIRLANAYFEKDKFLE